MSTMQAHEHKISLPTAILININIMLGAGIFINTTTLAQRAGALGALGYIVIGLMMLPLILCIAELLRLHPAGGFYAFAQKEISPFTGFLSGWSYFTSKLASAMLMMHVSMTLVQKFIPAIAAINIFALDSMFICLFVGLNMLNIKAGTTIQKMFIGFKTIPIFFAIFTGIFLLQGDNFSVSHMHIDGLASSIPLLVYAVIGFEAAASVSSKIKDAHKNAPLAVLISFGIVICIATLYQAIFYGVLGNTLATAADYPEAFPALLSVVFPNNALFAHKLEGIIHLAIASSTLGASYGILFSNSWNLHILAQNKHILFSNFFAKLNRHLIPFACVITEGVLCFLYLAVSRGSKIPLQQIGAFGCVIAYAFSVAALLYAKKNNPQATIATWVPWLGLGSCAVLFAASIKSFWLDGMSSLIVYAALIVLGIIMYWVTKRQ